MEEASSRRNKRNHRKRDREHKRRWKGIERCGKSAENKRLDPGPKDKQNFEDFRNSWMKESASPSFQIADARKFLGRLMLYGENDLTNGDKKVLQDEILDRVRQNKDCANAALAYYNEQNPDVEFNHVDPLYSCAACAFEIDKEGRWYHLNFVAKPKSAGPEDYSSFKLFFAELNYRDGVEVVDGRNRICKCCIVDPNTCSEVTVGCGWCDPEYEIYHPIGSFRVGNKYEPLDSFCPGEYHPVGIFRDCKLSEEEAFEYRLKYALDFRAG